LRKIREWCKEDKNFRKEIEEYHLKSKRKIAPPKRSS
jgi:hypothetical protein